MSAFMKLFAGANTAEGFHSCFDTIFANRDIVFYIKGAPGTGKNALMRRIADALTTAGETVCEYYCSSDPSSLDGVSCEGLNAAIFDSTPPHAYEPTLPSARDIYVNLADSIDVQALRPLKPKLEALQSGMKALYARAYDLLAAAEHIRGAEKNIECAELNDEISGTRTIDADKCREGLQKRAFLCAYTCEGFVDFSKHISARSAISVPARFGFGITKQLKRLSEARALKGLDTLLFSDPISPKRIRGAYLSDTDTLITLSEHGSGGEMFESITQKACETLAEAKAMHDEIEKCYTPHNDFSGMGKIEARIMRLLRQDG